MAVIKLQDPLRPAQCRQLEMVMQVAALFACHPTPAHRKISAEHIAVFAMPMQRFAAKR